jgi:hypothetical protein
MQTKIQARLQRIKDLLSKLRRKKPTTIIQIQPPQHKVIVVPPLELCETPKPLQLFQAKDHHIAHNLAKSFGFAILFHEYDKLNSERSLVYWILPQDFIIKLLKCFKDLRSADEFSIQERMILNDLVNKGWLKKMIEKDKTYYYRLNQETAGMLARQLAHLSGITQQPLQN